MEHEPGTFCWAELVTTDAEAAAFYAGVFGWTAEKVPSMDYHMLRLDTKEVGGMIKIRPDMGPMPPHWMVYVAVRNCDETTAEAKKLGGCVYVEPRDIPGFGRFCVLADPQGAGFALWQRETR